jgi:O-antigen/teichoic acid export membrane protein
VASGTGVTLGVFPQEWIYEAALLGLLQSLIVFHSQLLISAGKIKENNWLQLCQTIFLLAAVSIEYLIWDNTSPEGFARALGVALGATLVISIFMLHGSWKSGPTVRVEEGDVRRKLFRYGTQGSTGSIFQMLTNRSNLSLLEHTVGSAGAGVYSVVYYGAEAVWTIARALAPMVNNEVAVASSRETRMAITRKYLKLTLVLTLPLVAAAVLMPEFVYEWVFGINGIAWPIRILAPGMIAGAISSILAHHLSGVGLHKWNAITSALGFAVLLSVGYVTVAEEGVQGAAMAASCAYCVQAVGLIWVWSKKG